jgi:hypothetical protein
LQPHCKACARAEGAPARDPGRRPFREERAQSLVGRDCLRSASGSRCARAGRKGSIKRRQAQLGLAILAGNSAARLRARHRNFTGHCRSRPYQKVRRIRLRRLLHRYQQGASTAVVQHAELRQSRKTKASAFAGGLRRRFLAPCRLRSRQEIAAGIWRHRVTLCGFCIAAPRGRS